MRLPGCLAFAAVSCVAAYGWQADKDLLSNIESAQRKLREAPDLESNTVSLASLYLNIGQNRPAVDILKNYLQSHPDASKCLRLLALAYLREEDFSTAKETAERALRIEGHDADTLEVLGMSELGLQTIPSADRHLAEALKLNPSSPEANLQLGLLWAKERRNLPEAIRVLEKARTLQPQTPGTYAALGSVYLASGNSQKAVDYLHTAIKMAPQVAEPYYLLANAYRDLHEEGKADEALAAFNSHKKAEADSRASEMRGRADYEEGVNLLANSDQLDKAYAALRIASIAMPDFDPAYYRLAQVSYLKGDLPNALASIRQALKLNPFEPEYYFVLARCLEDSDPKSALSAVEKAISFRSGVPDFEELRQALLAKLGGAR